MSLIESPVRESPAQLRRRLFNPPNGRNSDELETVSTAVEDQRRRMRILAAMSQAEREARLLRDARAARASELAREYQFKLTAWVLEGLAEPAPPAIPKILFEQIIAAVSKFYNIPRIHIVSHRRTWDVVKPRQVAMYLGREITELSFPMIGARMGRDHTTVLHGASKIAEEIASGDSALAAEIDQIKTMIEAT